MQKIQKSNLLSIKKYIEDNFKIDEKTINLLQIKYLKD